MFFNAAGPGLGRELEQLPLDVNRNSASSPIVPKACFQHDVGED